MIVSLAIPNELLKEVDQVVKLGEYASRSEIIRASLREFLSRHRWLSGLEGCFLATIMFTYLKGRIDLEKLTDLKHEFDDVIATEMHTHLEKENCLEVLVIKGDASRIKKLKSQLSAIKGIRHVELISIAI
ncbi:MAG: ribbon-helix-helix protein, CopG family [Candidatus Nezhaarchaeales archaeon]